MRRVNIYPVKGIRLASAPAGIKYADRDDVVLMALPEGATSAAVFTQNAFCAAPVTIAKKHLSEASPRYLLINSGNANAGTGEPGYRDAMETCKTVGAAVACPINQILPFSTGVIGQRMETSKFAAVMPRLLETLDESGWEKAANAIMTTDTVEKIVSKQTEIDGKSVTVTGISKGSGMIHPDMATMLGYVATDAKVEANLLQKCLNDAVSPSFNSITVDGDTSTNDACVLIASGEGELTLGDVSDTGYEAFSEAVKAVCMELARKIVLDGEGATKLIEIKVDQALSAQEARNVAFTIAHSPLVKTAMFASDPNWGRILAAVGRTGITDFDIDQIKIWLGDVCIVEQGGVAASYTEEAGQSVMDKAEIIIRIDLARGKAEARVLTCDLSYDYVKINAEYRT
ncbi:MAG: bifunctional glutamate N-acetyltransferase/amino-acid acetyltransferase ArgJ [Gammaproteobacteria bacterium]|nr:bifunctional glutamate N-acetyltransferase/amino-acid acetyltransferase ArgJ [Gammaproteobacteria bacterium]